MWETVCGRGTKGDMWEPSVLPAEFFCKPKTALKNDVHYLEIIKKPMRSVTPSSSRHTEERGFPETFPLLKGQADVKGSSWDFRSTTWHSS